ncbi:MAG: 16S rRNA (cytosine(1402)-N(4))-methyltransferase RsmH [Bdellovibrionales bacterium]|nr:16S rRNA (cytosine(1402)-N(4))-methyltransferase RsmH [Bdellovibrionales bacterium]
MEAFRALPAEVSGWIVDCTFGGGGHTDFLLQSLSKLPGGHRHRVLGVDQDPMALERGRQRFQKEIAEGRLVLIQAHFSEHAAWKAAVSGPIFGLLADLGFSSDQMDDLDRGLSFQSDGPLDMRMDPARPMTAESLLQEISERDLEKILSEFGEERFAGRIARALVEDRKRGKLPKTPKELGERIRQAVPPDPNSRIHPATRSFQALRIAVNQELEELDALLRDGILTLEPGGRVAILSFHSLEDRKVKDVFRIPAKGETGDFRNLTPKPIVADDDEVRANPRSRSAKLRVAERLAPGEVVRKKKEYPAHKPKKKDDE